MATYQIKLTNGYVHDLDAWGIACSRLVELNRFVASFSIRGVDVTDEMRRFIFENGAAGFLNQFPGLVPDVAPQTPHAGPAQLGAEPPPGALDF